MLNRLNAIFLGLFFLITGCAKQWADSEIKPERLPKLKQKDFILKLDSIKSIAPLYMYSKLKINYKDTERNVSFKTTLKSVKDSAVSVLITFARIPVFGALIDTSHLTILNKKDNCYTKGLINELSKTSGINFKYENIEELIFGHPIGYESDQKYHMLNDHFHYILSNHRKGQGRKKKEIVYSYSLHRDQNHLASTSIWVPADSVQIEAVYSEWQFSGNKYLPKKIELNIQSPKVSAQIRIEYTKLDTTTPESLFLIIPEKYEKCD